MILFIPHGVGKQSFSFDLDHELHPQHIKVDFYQTFTPGTSAAAYNGCVEGTSWIPQQQYQQHWCVLFDRQNNYIHSRGSWGAAAPSSSVRLKHLLYSLQLSCKYLKILPKLVMFQLSCEDSLSSLSLLWGAWSP